MNNKANQTIITIDGPAGAGKSTMAKALAARLHWLYLDTGAIYRAVAVLVLSRGIAPEDREAAEELAQSVAPELTIKSEAGGSRMFYGSEELTSSLRTVEVSGAASIISAWPGVRAALLDTQRRLGKRGRLVVEGRDMGTVVFPLAGLKFFLSANPKERLRRRWLELKAAGQLISLDELSLAMTQRDQADRNRPLAPLKSAPEALTIDSSELSIEQVLDIMEKNARKVFDLKAFNF